eukprot:TRINITY_DN3340_c0_g3_i1.p1 TRINITY_DN3340_c0_g3~~TRINITY_DN3340_c0_g3_i1.p1  ORF type:complete len:287 (+),score=82.18 TRINITY_DN3340_c0_g3_i1:82-861(+)
MPHTPEVRRDGDKLVATLPMPPESLAELEVECEGRRLRVHSAGVDVSADLPCEVDGEAAQARYQKKARMLTVTMPIQGGKEMHTPATPQAPPEAGATVADFSPGARVEVHGLKSMPALNGIRGTVKGPQGDRVGVCLPHPYGSKALKPGNLRLVEEDDDGMCVDPEVSPLDFAVEDTVEVSADVAEVRRLCKQSDHLPWHGSKERWCGRSAQVVSCDLRDRSVQLRHSGGSLCWFPAAALRKLSSPHGSAEPVVAVGGD